MIFTIFRDFSEFFLIFNDFIFYLNRFKINKKNKKYRFFFCRAGPAWMRRGMQGHMAAPREPVQRLRGAYIYSIIYIIFNIV